MFEGSNRHFDQTLCMGLSITDEDIDSLCQSMKELVTGRISYGSDQCEE